MVAQAQKYEPLYDIDPETGVSIEVFYADRTLETFGRDGAGWFWWPRRRRLSPDGPATGPFATSYAAYRHAMKKPARTTCDAGTVGEQSVAFHVPIVGHGQADTGYYSVKKPSISRHFLNWLRSGPFQRIGA
jgi:hypothetical protein